MVRLTEFESAAFQGQAHRNLAGTGCAEEAGGQYADPGKAGHPSHPTRPGTLQADRAQQGALPEFLRRYAPGESENTDDPLAEGTVEGTHSCLRGILSDAVEAGYITHNPAWRAYKKKGVTKERLVAGEETVQRLIAALETQSLKYEVYYKLILATGMRWDEACGLRWSDIDWRQRALHTWRNVVKLTGWPILVKEPKTRAGVRVVCLSKDMCKLLRAWEKECQWEKQQLGAGELTRDNYLFHQPNGDPMVPCTFTYRFKMILRENGLSDDLNVHSLRHPYVKYTTKI